MLSELCFSTKFIQWVMQYVKTISCSIMINGEPNPLFTAAKGLKQGDLISPYLFTVVMEYLSKLLNVLKDNKTFSYHPRCAKLSISHLCFAVDLLLFAKGNLKSVITLIEQFDIFAQASGLQANKEKSFIYFGGVSNEEKMHITQAIGLTRANYHSNTW